jgi:hypothetical protein
MPLDATLKADLQRQLSASAVERWGVTRAGELREAIDTIAETLALVAAARLDDDVEPDPGVPQFDEGNRQ